MVCLPSQFTGGALVTRCNSQQVTYDWSSPADKIQWAAFINDVEMEILPITEGHLVILIYNLYHCNQLNPLPTVDVTTSPFHNNLKAALSHPHFLREGGTLGFPCQHAYVFEEFKITWEDVVDELHDLPMKSRSVLLRKLKETGEYADSALQVNKYADSAQTACSNQQKSIGEPYAPNVVSKYVSGQKFNKAMDRVRSQRHLSKVCLKGSDRTVFFDAKSLGLNVNVKPILNPPDYPGYYIGDVFKFEPNVLVGHSSVGDDVFWWDHEDFRGDACDVTWCQKFSTWQPAIAASVVGCDDPYHEICYQAAAILIPIPAWSERHN